MATEINRICFDVSSGLLSCFSIAGWDLEINSFRKGYLNVLLDKVEDERSGWLCLSGALKE